MDIAAGQTETTRSPGATAMRPLQPASACGRDCSTCPKRVECPLSTLLSETKEGGRA